MLHESITTSTMKHSSVVLNSSIFEHNVPRPRLHIVAYLVMQVRIVVLFSLPYQEPKWYGMELIVPKLKAHY